MAVYSAGVADVMLEAARAAMAASGQLDSTLCYLSESSQAVKDLPLEELYRRIDDIASAAVPAPTTTRSYVFAMSVLDRVAPAWQAA